MHRKMAEITPNRPIESLITFGEEEREFKEVCSISSFEFLDIEMYSYMICIKQSKKNILETFCCLIYLELFSLLD